MTDYKIYATEAGSILLDGDKVVASDADASQLVSKAKKLGALAMKVSDEKALGVAREMGLEARGLSSDERAELDARRVGLIVESGLAPDQAAALELIRQRSISEAEEAIREASSRPDLHLVQAIQALDEAEKYLNVTATRASEWYGLHFPELLPILQDNNVLCKTVIEIGRRNDFTAEKLAGRGLSDKKIEAIMIAKERSKGGEITDADWRRLSAIASLAVQLNMEREKLNDYVEGAMKRISPNVAQVAGATIGARLMAKAGGLDRLAVLPASTIQILGAEKALFRALRTGARPPKHGILFQHQEVHTAPKWQRGKIARTLANKIAISARIDYYRGSAEESVKRDFDKRLEQIKTKYKEPPPRRPMRPERPQRRERFDRRQKQRRR